MAGQEGNEEMTTEAEEASIYQRAWAGMLPQAADELTAYARTHGWHTRVTWSREPESGKIKLVLSVGRLKNPGHHNGPRWTYRLTWVCRGESEFPNKLSRSIKAVTPERPNLHQGPSIIGLRTVIRANPVPKRRPR
jgi:hypothetical protein